MSRSNCSLILVVVVVLGLAAISLPQAHAGWGCGRACYTPCWSSCWYSGPCYTVTYSPSCYSSCWYGGCRLGPYCGPSYWPCGWSYSSSCCVSTCYGCWWDTACCGTVAVHEPASEPSPPSPPSAKPTPAPPEPESAETGVDTSLVSPEPGPPEPPTKGPEASPSDAEPRAPQPAPQPPTPGAVQPPASIPDAGETPAERGGSAAPAQPTPAGPQAGGVTPAQQASGVIAVWVPAQASVVINGLQTTSTGPYRAYVSHGLKRGAVYRYEIRAQVARDGRLVEKTRTVYLTAGARRRVAFHFEARPEGDLAAVW
jgi:uncharacterized protein (TIGR03000 family)